MKRTGVALIVLLAICSAVALSPGETRRSAVNSAVALVHRIEPLEWTRSELAQIRQDMIARHPSLASLEGRQLALEIQRLAHGQIKVGSRPGDLEGDLFTLYKDAAVARTTSYSCQGKNLIFRAMLTAFGFRNRAAMFYASVEQLPNETVNSHASADVFLDGHWEAIDATFNFHLEDATGKHLDWITAYDRIKSGKNVRAVSSGSPAEVDPLTAAGIVLNRDLRYLAVIDRHAVLRPETWDGNYRIRNRLHWNVATESFSADTNFPLLAEAN